MLSNIDNFCTPFLFIMGIGPFLLFKFNSIDDFLLFCHNDLILFVSYVFIYLIKVTTLYDCDTVKITQGKSSYSMTGEIPACPLGELGVYDEYSLRDFLDSPLNNTATRCSNMQKFLAPYRKPRTTIN